MLVFSSAEMTNSPGPSGRPWNRRWYKSSTTPALAAKSGSRGKIQERCCHGLIGSSASQRHSVVVDTSSTRPVARTSVRSSARLQRPRGIPRVAGSSQAIALHAAMTAAGKARGRPGRLRSRRPSKPSWLKRLRHLPTVLTASPSLRAIAWLGHPAAASRTILALVTWRCWAVPRRVRAFKNRRSDARRLIWNGLRPPPPATVPPVHRPALPAGQRRRLRDATGRDRARWAGGDQGDPRVDQGLTGPAATRPPARALARAGHCRCALPGPVRLRRRRPGRRRGAGAVPAAVCRLGEPVGVRDLPGQPRRLPGLSPAKWPAGRHARGGPGLRLRALPRQPHRLAGAPPTRQSLTTHELPYGSTRRPRLCQERARVFPRRATRRPSRFATAA